MKTSFYMLINFFNKISDNCPYGLINITANYIVSSPIRLRAEAEISSLVAVTSST